MSLELLSPRRRAAASGAAGGCAQHSGGGRGSSAPGLGAGFCRQQDSRTRWDVSGCGGMRWDTARQHLLSAGWGLAAVRSATEHRGRAGHQPCQLGRLLVTWQRAAAPAGLWRSQGPGTAPRVVLLFQPARLLLGRARQCWRRLVAALAEEGDQVVPRGPGLDARAFGEEKVPIHSLVEPGPSGSCQQEHFQINLCPLL